MGILRRNKCTLLMMAGALLFTITAGHAADYNVIDGTNKHDIEAKDGRMLPDCGNPTPCVGDIKGTEAPDKISGLDGWDWINGRLGNDLIYGGPGMDQVYAQEGNDTLQCGGSHDHCFGGDGDDVIHVEDGADEAGHVEEIHGDQTQKGESGYDVCFIDEDPGDGIVLDECEKTTVLAVSGAAGVTKVYGDVRASENDNPYDTVTPGTYTRFGGTH